mgnify:CR=1 FL=1
MKKGTKDSIDILKIIEIILLFIVIFLVIVLIVLEVMHNEYAIYERIYDYDAYRVIENDNSITAILYHKDGDIIKTEEIYYFENDKIIKNEVKYYFERISIAKEEYNTTAKMIQDNLNSGSNEQIYLLSKDENAVVYTYLNPQNSFVEDENKEVGNNENIETSILNNIDEKYNEYYTKLQ